MTHPKHDSLLRNDDVWLRPPGGTRLLLLPALPPALDVLLGHTAMSAAAARDEPSSSRLCVVRDLRRPRSKPGPWWEAESGLRGWLPAEQARGDGNLDSDLDPAAGPVWDEEPREGAEGG